MARKEEPGGSDRYAALSNEQKACPLYASPSRMGRDYPQDVTVPSVAPLDCKYSTNMENALANRLERLQSATLQSEQALARQRQLIDDLRSDGYRTTEAEAVLQRFEANRQGLLAKLACLQEEQAAAD